MLINIDQTLSRTGVTVRYMVTGDLGRACWRFSSSPTVVRQIGRLFSSSRSLLEFLYILLHLLRLLLLAYTTTHSLLLVWRLSCMLVRFTQRDRRHQFVPRLFYIPANSGLLSLDFTPGFQGFNAWSILLD